MKLLAAMVLLACSAAAQSPPLYRAGRVLDPISIDGVADELTWGALDGVGPFENVRGPEAARTRSVVAWDDDNAWGTLTQRDAALWTEEVVEVFLDPDGDGRNYAELEINPDNVVVDLLIPAPGIGSGQERLGWDIEGLQTAVRVQPGQGWTVEIAIPWASLARTGVTAAPKPGDRWRVGLYRIERPDGPEDPETNRQYLAWSRTERHFHEPDRFGVIEFALAP
jgi:hypothetical protein